MKLVRKGKQNGNGSEEMNEVSISRTKIVIYFLIFALLTVATVTPSLFVQLSEGEKQSIQQELISRHYGATEIFGNNLFIGILMFVPFFGFIWSIIVSFNTGVAISAFDGNMINIFLNPMFWVEYLVYAYIVTTSMMVTVKIVYRLLKGEGIEANILTRLFTPIGKATVALFLCALLEIAFLT